MVKIQYENISKEDALAFYTVGIMLWDLQFSKLLGNQNGSCGRSKLRIEFMGDILHYNGTQTITDDM